MVAAGNTYNPSLLVLMDKGYRLKAESAENGSLWIASKGGNSFLAYSPPELLGIVVLFEHYGESWNRQQPDMIAKLLGAEEEDESLSG